MNLFRFGKASIKLQRRASSLLLYNSHLPVPKDIRRFLRIHDEDWQRRADAKDTQQRPPKIRSGENRGLNRSDSSGRRRVILPAGARTGARSRSSASTKRKLLGRFRPTQLTAAEPCRSDRSPPLPISHGNLCTGNFGKATTLPLIAALEPSSAPLPSAPSHFQRAPDQMRACQTVRFWADACSLR